MFVLLCKSGVWHVVYKLFTKPLKQRNHEKKNNKQTGDVGKDFRFLYRW